MSHKRIYSLFASFLAITCLASCLTTNTSTNPSNNSASDKTSNTDNNGPLEIVFWHTSGKNVSSGFEYYGEQFAKLVKENDGVDIKFTFAYQGGYDDIYSKVIKGFAAGNYPNIAIAYPDHVADYLASEGDQPGKYVVDLSSYVNDDEVGFGKESWIGDGDSKDFIPAFYQESSAYERKGIYSLPLMKSSEALYYNKTVVDRYLPKYKSELNTEAKRDAYMNSLTWDDLMNFASFIKSQDGNSDKYSKIVMADSDSNLFIASCYQNNIPYVSLDSNYNASIDFNNAQAKAMVTKFKGYHKKGLFFTKGTEGTYASNNFTAEDCLFDIGSTGGAGYNEPNGNSFIVGVAKPPLAGSKEVYINQGLTATIFKYKDPDGRKALYSYKFLKYLTSAEINSDLCINLSEGYVPVRESAYNTDLYQDYLANENNDFMPKVANVVHNEIGDKYFYSPAFKGSAKARSEVGGILTQVLLGNKDVDTAFADAENNTRLSL